MVWSDGWEEEYTSAPPPAAATTAGSAWEAAGEGAAAAAGGGEGSGGEGEDVEDPMISMKELLREMQVSLLKAVEEDQQQMNKELAESDADWSGWSRGMG